MELPWNLTAGRMSRNDEIRSDSIIETFGWG